MRSLGQWDRLVAEFDHGLRTVLNPKPEYDRPSPASGVSSSGLDCREVKVSRGLMRVDHTGEICAQALYRGQAFTAKTDDMRTHLLQAAHEEQDHLAWCGQRLSQLHTHTSWLNGFWYSASFLIGAANSLIGEAWSLGFVVATEEQVEQHIVCHLERLPKTDAASRKILSQMQADEADHAQQARAKGAERLPRWLQLLMTCQSKVMTTTAYYL